MHRKSAVHSVCRMSRQLWHALLATMMDYPDKLLKIGTYEIMDKSTKKLEPSNRRPGPYFKWWKWVCVFFSGGSNFMESKGEFLPSSNWVPKLTGLIPYFLSQETLDGIVRIH